MVSEKGIVHIGESTDVGRNWIDALLVGKKNSDPGFKAMFLTYKL